MTLTVASQGVKLNDLEGKVGDLESDLLGFLTN